MCGERTGAVVLWQPSHHPSGCCTLVVVEERHPDPSPHMVAKRFGCTTIHNKVLYKCIIVKVHIFKYTQKALVAQKMYSSKCNKVNVTRYFPPLLWVGAQILLQKEISISIKLVSRWKHKVLQKHLVDGCIDFGLDITQWTNTSRRHGTPNHH